MFLIAAGAVVLLLVGATAGLALSGKFGNSAPATPDTSSVDAGFARDMIVHHDQGVLMAHYAEQNTTDAEISVMAYDLGYTQTDQIGQMQGWLSLWDLPESTDGTHMTWMGSDADAHGGMEMGTVPGRPPAVAQGALMPGMATNDEIAKLQNLTRDRVRHLLPATDDPAPPGRPADDAVCRRARHQPGGAQLRRQDGRLAGLGDLRHDADAGRAWCAAAAGC